MTFMFEKPPKRLLILFILDILRKYTDENHRLSQKDIVEKLKTEYNMTVDRKAVRRNILDLIECGYNIEYSESVRTITDPDTGGTEETYIWTDFYLVRDFTDSEIRLLIDSVLFSMHIPYNQCRELVGKLEKLSNIYFHSQINHVSKTPDGRADNMQLFLNIELLDEAISRGRKVSFHYLEYGTDKNLHYRTRSDGTVREYIISPYQMAAREGKYYLICNNDEFNDISNYRIDRITDVMLLDTPARIFEGLERINGRTLDLEEYMNRHPYMYASENIAVKMRVSRKRIGDVIDMFGSEVQFSEESEDSVAVTTVTNAMSAMQFAKSYSPAVEILEPLTLRDRVRADLEETLQAYRK